MSMYCLPSFKMEVISYYSLIDDCYHQLLAPDRTFNQRRSPLPFPYPNETPTPHPREIIHPCRPSAYIWADRGKALY